MNITDLPYDPLVQRTSLIYSTVQDSWQVWGMCKWGKTREEVILSLGLHVIYIFIIFACAKERIGKAYTDEHICMF
jgi:hypothetical protein